jgi:hypothetical protein
MFSDQVLIWPWLIVSGVTLLRTRRSSAVRVMLWSSLTASVPL